MKAKIPVLSLALATSALGQPAITTQPLSQTNYVRTTATFIVAATGTEPVTYQWQWDRPSTDFTDLLDETNAILTISGVQTNDAANYRAIVTDATGNTNSIAVHLTVLIPATLFISQSAPGFVTLSWTGNMALLAGQFGASGNINWYMLTNASPVTQPIWTNGPEFFRLVALETVDLQGHLDLCNQGQVKDCEECIKDYFVSRPGPWPASGEMESAASIGVELGSSYCSHALSWLLALRWGIQPPFYQP